MIKVNQHALINLVYSYMVRKVFNIQPVLFHQCYLCRLLWFKKQSFTLVWKPNPPVCLCWCSECRLSACAKIASLHVISEIWLLLQCAVALQRADALEQQTMHLHKCDHVNFFLLGGGVVRLTAKPRYLLLHHRGKEKSNTVTALLHCNETDAINQSCSVVFSTHDNPEYCSHGSQQTNWATDCRFDQCWGSYSETVAWLATSYS